MTGHRVVGEIALRVRQEAVGRVEPAEKNPIPEGMLPWAAMKEIRKVCRGAMHLLTGEKVVPI